MPRTLRWGTLFGAGLFGAGLLTPPALRPKVSLAVWIASFREMDSFGPRPAVSRFGGVRRPSPSVEREARAEREMRID